MHCWRKAQPYTLCCSIVAGLMLLQNSRNPAISFLVAPRKTNCLGCGVTQNILLFQWLKVLRDAIFINLCWRVPGGLRRAQREN